MKILTGLLRALTKMPLAALHLLVVRPVMPASIRLANSILVSALWTLCAVALIPFAAAQTPVTNSSPQRQDTEALRQTVEQFLRKQSAGLPGDVTVTAGAVDARMNLPACPQPEAFLPPGGRLWGKTTVGVRCNAPSPWTIYLTATVCVVGEYVAAAVPLGQGQLVAAHDVIKVKGDLTAMPNGIVTDPAQAIGRTLATSVRAGTPLRHDSLRSPRAVQAGQIVKLVSTGPGFRVSADGKALGHGTEGQIVQASTANGQVVSGVARANGVVEVTY
jgi:flagellar basal body P-ring formation protein FlgA